MLFCRVALAEKVAVAVAKDVLSPDSELQPEDFQVGAQRREKTWGSIIVDEYNANAQNGLVIGDSSNCCIHRRKALHVSLLVAPLHILAYKTVI